jgi:hypothetical protein
MRKTFLMAFLVTSLALTSFPTFAQTESTYVAMDGYVESYGEELAYGWLGALAEIDQWAEVDIFWSMENLSLELPANYSFYAATLVNTETVKLNYTGKDFYVSGRWDVWNVTFYYDETGNYSYTAELIVDDGPGELNVLNGWAVFTVNIIGIQSIAGVVAHSYVGSVKVPIGDLNWDHIINIHDLFYIAKAYEDTPGMGRYAFNIDLNHDFKIDIIDLTTIAANLGKSY